MKRRRTCLVALCLLLGIFSLPVSAVEPGPVDVQVNDSLEYSDLWGGNGSPPPVRGTKAHHRVAKIAAHRYRDGQLGLLKRRRRLIQQRVSEQQDVLDGHILIVIGR